jgi:hypothetical protein
MNIKFIAKVNGYLCHIGEENLYPFSFDNLKLSNDTAILKTYFPEQFNLFYIGLMSGGVYRNDYFIYFIGESSTIPQLNNVVNIDQIGEIINSHLQTYLISLWFVKNCSTNINKCIVTNVDTGEASINAKAFLYTDSKGLYPSAIFKISELKNAFARLGKIWEFFLKGNPDIIPESTYEGLKANKFTSLPYKNLPRIGRSLMFLDLARSQPLLPLKISFYIVLLESLFTSTTSEVTHQVSERTALFVGTNKTEKKEIFNVIKKAYNYRSTYMHGQLIKNPIEELQVTAFQIDNVIRKLYIKILDGESEIFQEADNEKYNDYFRDLIFQ